MERDDGQGVSVYMVWSPQLGGGERHVPNAASLMPDRRVAHYWDPEMRVGTVFQYVAELSQPAWDFWMLFDEDAMWIEGTRPPEPAWWEHQLRGLPAERHLDPDRFADIARKLRVAPAAAN